mgnify:CR=1 FL=1
MAVDKKVNYDVQGGVKNYLGKQKQVKAPLKWQSSPDHPTTELAYITEAEKNLLIKSDLHGSLKGSVNKGPSGIISLNGFGSTDSSQNVGGGDVSSAETGGGRSGMTEGDANDFRSAAIAAGGGQRVNPGFFDSRNTVSPDVLARAKTFAPQAFKSNRRNSIMDFITGGGIIGSGIRGLGQKLGLGKQYNQPTYDMSEFSDMGLLSDRVNPTFQNDLGNELMLSTEERPTQERPTQVFNFDNLRMKPSSLNNIDLSKLETSDLNNLASLVAASQMPQRIDNSMYGADQDRFGIPSFIDEYDSNVGLETNLNLQAGPDGITYYNNNDDQGIMGIDVGYPSNDLMVGLTKKQKQMLAGPQKNLRNIMGISDQQILNNISDFNNPKDPATVKEVQDFYTT